MPLMEIPIANMFSHTSGLGSRFEPKELQKCNQVINNVYILELLGDEVINKSNVVKVKK